MNQIDPLPSQFNRIQRGALIAGIVGLVASIVGLLINPQQFFQSYLIGYIYWLQIALGSIGLVMLHYLVGGRWSFAIRRLLEAGAMTLLPMALLFIPILLGAQSLYLWARPEEVAESALLQYKTPYLNLPFFIGRTLLYFVIWIGLAYLLNRWSIEQDRTADVALYRRLKSLSAIGIILYMLTSTFAAFDWMMSLEPEWYSSIYGVIFIAGQAVATIAFSLILLASLARREPLANWLSVDVFNDLGNFLLAFISFWAYVSFSQYLIIWSANLPETVTWYIRRTQGGWQWLAIILIFCQFAIPFALLLSRRAKRNTRLLVAVAVFVLLMRFVDIFWMIKPAFYPEGFYIHWLDIVLPLGIGGFWVAFFVWRLRQRALLPLHDPRFEEAVVHG
jgi:hypothetical protein